MNDMMMIMTSIWIEEAGILLCREATCIETAVFLEQGEYDDKYIELLREGRYQVFSKT